MRKLEGKIALITGASRGIGRSVAHGFAREGAQLFLVGHVDQHALEDASRIAREAVSRSAEKSHWNGWNPALVSDFF